jgi:hypothetical protein
MIDRDDPREAERADPHAGASDDPRVDPTPDRAQSEKPVSSKRNAFGIADPTAQDPRPTAQSLWENRAAGDDAMEDRLTEEDQPTPAQRDDVAQQETLDP